jgi:hypothetical protein
VLGLILTFQPKRKRNGKNEVPKYSMVPKIKIKIPTLKKI